ncbi:MAG: prolyl oligopeptidase family serine peptidase [Planctomycetes bacterium]|nr:prolyl oligopeptidase family serine peptidase [Planctomycetota bacterium]MCB9885915.1 prolyl oligopeptidase family serine peptidase [Planctomycetota bacterium]
MKRLTRKLWKTVKWTLLVVVGLVTLTVAILAVTGVPNLGQVVTRNVPRVSWSNLMDMLGIVPEPQALLIHGFGKDGALEFVHGAGPLMKYDATTGEVIATTRTLPFAVDIQPVPGSDDFLFLQDRSTDERYDLMLQRTSTGAAETLLSTGYGVYQYRVAPDGSLVVAYVIDLETHRHTLYRVDLEGDRTPKALCSFGGHLSIQAFDSGLRHAFGLHTEDDKTARLLRIDLADGTHEVVFAEEREGEFYHGNDPAWLFLRTRFVLGKDDELAFYARTGEAEDEREFVCLWERNLRTGESRRLSPPQNADVCQFCVSHDERHVVYVMVEKGHPALHVFDRREGRDHVVYDDRGDVIAHQWVFKIVADPAKNVAYFVTASTSLSGTRLMSVDLQTREVATIVDRRAATSTSPAIVTTEFEYPTSAPAIGVMQGIHTYKLSPATTGPQKHGVVILFHGGPDTSLAPLYAATNPLVGHILSRGNIVLIPNYRGSWGYGTTFERADDGRNRESQIEDVGALLEWIEQQPDLDGERIAVYGESWGGYFVTQSLIRYPEAFVGGLSLVGVTGLKAVAQTRFFCGWEREIGDLSAPGMAEFLDSISPCNNSEKIVRPLYMFVGGQDPRVVPGPSRQMATAMEQAGQEIWYVEIPYAGHGIQGASPQDLLYTATTMMEFLDRLGM